jgi:hypothetical protein
MSENKQEVKDLVLKMRDEGKVVFATFEGLSGAVLEDFIKQPAEGILYDLNRDGATVLTFIDDPKWVNDFAVGLVITKLKEQLEAVEHGVQPTLLTLCPECGVEQIVTHLPTCAHYVAQSG